MAFAYKLELADGTPADPPEYKTAVPNWKSGDTIPLRTGRMLRVVDVRPPRDDNDQPVLVVVEDEPFRF
jgi:hypothetical protein